MAERQTLSCRCPRMGLRPSEAGLNGISAAAYCGCHTRGRATHIAQMILDQYLERHVSNGLQPCSVYNTAACLLLQC